MSITPKMSKSIEQLWAREPFYAEVLSKCRFIKSKTITAGVNITKAGMNFYWGEDFINSLTIKQMNYLMMHEVFHLISNHGIRGKHYKKQLANICMDMIINSFLDTTHGMDLYMKHPAEPILLVPKEYNGKHIFEDLYKWIVDNNLEDYYMGMCFDMHPEDEVSPEEARQVAEEVLKSLKERGLLKGNLEEFIHELIKPADNPILKMKMDLAQQIKSAKQKTWSKPSLFGCGKGFRRKSKQLTVLLDSSGSMHDEFDKVLSYIFLKDVEINLIQCDAEVQREDRVTTMNQLKKLRIQGLGGTVLQPGVDVAKKKFPQDPFVILTDGYTDSLDVSGFSREVLILTCGDSAPISRGNCKQYVIESKK